MHSKPLLSICIPTLNRPVDFYNAFNSVLNSSVGHKIELIVSNNASDIPYPNISQDLLPSNISLKVFYQKKRMNIDEHLYFITAQAKSKYIYLLGDDDIFLPDALERVTEIIMQFNPDLLISATSGKGLKTTKEYYSVELAFLFLRKKCTFGAVLVKKKYLIKKYFVHLYGSSHAYSSFWIPLFWRKDRGKSVKIIYLEGSLIKLGESVKNYNPYLVMYRDAIYGFKMRRELLPKWAWDGVMQIHINDHYKRILSIKSLVKVFFNNSLYEFKIQTPDIWRKHKIKVLFSWLFSSIISRGITFKKKWN
jgi:glycosyltransferase involved in cell wall biosynthesis